MANNLVAIPVAKTLDDVPEVENIARWTDVSGWVDYGDGTAIGGPDHFYLLIGLAQFCREWVDNRPADYPYLSDKELGEKNGPEETWEVGMSGKPEPRVKRHIGVYFIDIDTGKSYKWEHYTVGAHMAFKGLKSAIEGKCVIEECLCRPVFHLTEAPWKLPTGLRKKPILEPDPGRWRIYRDRPLFGGLTAAPAPQLQAPASMPVAPVAADPAPVSESKPGPAKAEPVKPAEDLITTGPQPQPKPKVSFDPAPDAAPDRPKSTGGVVDDDELPY